MVASLVGLLQPRDRATDTFTTSREGAAESLAGSSLFFKFELNARSQLDLWWFVGFYDLTASILGHVS